MQTYSHHPIIMVVLGLGLMCLTACVLAPETCGSSWKTELVLNKRLNHHRISHLMNFRRDRCALECFLVKICASFNYRKRSGICELNSVTVDDVSTDALGNEPEFEYHDIRKWASVIAGTCANRPCAENQRCIQSTPYICVDIETCQSGWYRFDQSCYKGSTDTKYFDDAKTFCSSLDAHLVYIETSTENEALKHYVTSTYSGASNRWWIGMTDMESEGTWKKVDTNVSVLFFDWGPGEPNNHPGEDCGILASDASAWADFNCGYILNTLCEKRLDPDQVPQFYQAPNYLTPRFIQLRPTA